MEKYNAIIEMINKGINDFNKLLNATNYLPTIDRNRIEDIEASWKLKEQGWFDRGFPNGGKKGVYFVFGYNPENESEKALYVGKASHQNSMIGARLDKHLNNPDRDKKIYKMRHIKGIDFELDFVTTIPIDEMPFMSSAIEEFLIYFLKENQVNLLNHVGNK